MWAAAGHMRVHVCNTLANCTASLSPPTVHMPARLLYPQVAQDPVLLPHVLAAAGAVRVRPHGALRPRQDQGGGVRAPRGVVGAGRGHGAGDRGQRTA